MIKVRVKSDPRIIWLKQIFDRSRSASKHPMVLPPYVPPWHFPRKYDLSTFFRQYERLKIGWKHSLSKLIFWKIFWLTIFDTFQPSEVRSEGGAWRLRRKTARYRINVKTKQYSICYCCDLGIDVFAGKFLPNDQMISKHDRKVLLDDILLLCKQNCEKYILFGLCLDI